MLGGLALVVLAAAGLWPAVSVEAAPAAHTRYLIHCSGCHRADGSGSRRGGIPDLRGFVGSFGRVHDGRVYLMHVPGITASGLDDAGIAEVMNYIFTRWAEAPPNDPVPPFSADEVARLRALSVPDVVQARRAVVHELEARGLPVAAYPWQ
ncbi:cytochrome C [Salinisphaera sp. T31B1]|uniref:c-type cytochrome n=1 Tax=Salinisphaera sp. T31B1 TaxID=727963 RepID=UPI00333EA85A